MHEHHSTARPDRATTLPSEDFDAGGPDERADLEAEVKRLLAVDGLLGTALGVAEID